MSNVTQQIDSMVAVSAGTASPASPASPTSLTFSGTLAQPHATLRANSADGTVELVGPSPSQQVGSEPERINDPGLDLAATGAQITANLKALQNVLNEVVYDPTTGAPSPKLQGRARELKQLELDNATNVALYQLERFQQIAAQRDADAVATAKAQYEEQQVAQFVAGNPQRAEALKAALLQREAGEFAERLLAGRVK